MYIKKLNKFFSCGLCEFLKLTGPLEYLECSARQPAHEEMTRINIALDTLSSGAPIHTDNTQFSAQHNEGNL